MPEGAPERRIDWLAVAGWLVALIVAGCGWLLLFMLVDLI